MTGSTFTKMRKARGRSVFEGEIKSLILETRMRCLLDLLQQKLEADMKVQNSKRRLG